jgi:DNA-binding CsgD family transcriptional regulator
MLVTIHHVISDPDTFWRLAARGVAHTPRGLAIQQMRPGERPELLTCTWQAPTLAQVQDFVDGAVGHVSRNSYSEPAISVLRGSHTRHACTEAEWMRALCDLIERFPTGLVLVDRRGRPLMANAEASAICSDADGLTLTRDALAAATARDAVALRRAVADAARAWMCGNADAGLTLTIERPSGGRPYSVLVVPLARPDRVGDDESVPAVAIFVTDPDRSISLNRQRLEPLYDLTPTEAHVAALVADGKSVEELSGALRISINTARWHLKHVLQKCGADSQRELVRLILRGPAALG